MNHAEESPAELESDLHEAIERFDWPRVTEISQGFIRLLRSATSVPVRDVKAHLHVLREGLRFDDLRDVADAALGQGLDDAAIRRQYAQSLADAGNPAAALDIFRGIAADPTVPDTERIEARGGVGRCFKELFLVTTSPGRRQEFLIRAIDAYLSAYREDAGRVWQGINAAALLARSCREHLRVTGHDEAADTARRIALAIVNGVDLMPAPDAWAMATAGEALVALGRSDAAVRWGNSFVLAPDASGFKIASYLRQLVQIWQLDGDAAPGDTLLPMLRSALLRSSGGEVTLETRDLRSGRLAGSADERLERVLGGDRYQSLTWYRRGLERCRAVALIENGNEDGIGTGFLLRGADLHPDLPPTVLVTNAHVVPESLAADDAVVTFHGLDGNMRDDRPFRVIRRWWYQPSTRPGLDTTLLELDGCPADVEPLPLARRLPALTGSAQRAYLIGHPRGLAQPQFSLQDNLLLDYDDTVVHYRSPTEGGSSGSPVFDSQWKFIGVHHAGGVDTPRLHNHGGTYRANEAIGVSAIQAALLIHPPMPVDVP